MKLWALSVLAIVIAFLWSLSYPLDDPKQWLTIPIAIIILILGMKILK